MLVCHCNLITSQEIEQTIRDFLEEDAWVLITPLKVYHAMEKRGRCFGCFPDVTGMIVRITEEFHRENSTAEADIIDFIKVLERAHRDAIQTVRSARAGLKPRAA